MIALIIFTGRRDIMGAFVFLVVEPPYAGFVFGVEPVRADHGEQNAAMRDLVVELLGKVHARLHGIDVHEQVVPGKPSRQIIEQPPGDPRARHRADN
jgi:hypothetical protein